MTMIERLARILDPQVWEYDLPVPTRADVQSFHQRRQDSCAKAKELIEAIREPTSEILDAPAMKNWLWNDGNPVSDGELRDAWQQMIDAALQEGKETVG